ncbi:MAG: hypothetical protein IKV87_07630 [Methanobrevibacter sp.]|nr:hypothetical protein [Methanobrevibacter sp.]
MGFNWERFIDVAEHLRKFSKREEYQRTAVGRYYYACFLEARDYYKLKTKKNLGRFSAHTRLFEYFQDSDNSIEKNIGEKLEELHNMRKNADYDAEFNKKHKLNSKKVAKEILDNLKILKE